jgi:U3 small nucleolar RNA-associated protein 22
MVVWHVAQYLSQEKFKPVVGKVVWRYGNADGRKPVLLLIPPIASDNNNNNNNNTAKEQQGKHKKKQKKQKQQKEQVQSTLTTKKLRFRVQLHFGMESTDWIPPLRLVPNRCNITASTTTTKETSGATQQRSQHYNHALLEDASHSFEGLSDGNKEEYPSWNASVILAKVWCLQRGLLRGHDGLTTEHLGLLILYLYRTKQTNPRMAPAQVLAALFKLLAETNWLGQIDKDPYAGHAEEEKSLLRTAPSEGYQIIVQETLSKRTVLVLPEEGRTSNQTIAASELVELYAKQTRESPLSRDDPKTLVELYQKDVDIGPVFLDPSLAYNYFGRLSPSFMRLVQREARKSLDCLHSQAIRQPFQYLFMTPVRFWSRSDAYMKVPLNSIAFGSKLWGQNQGDIGNYESVARGIVNVLRMALGDRVRSIRLLTTGNGSISGTVAGVEDSDEIPAHEIRNASRANSRLQSPTGSTDIVLGLTLNPDTCFRVVDRGPPADDVEATRAFLDLWGKSKAELRRFKDGAIVHAVVWEPIPEKSGTSDDASPYINFQNGDQVQGGIVERIARHVLRQHFLKETKLPEDSLQFSLRNILATVDGVVQCDPSDDSAFLNPLTAHKKVMKAFETLSNFLRTNSLPTLPVSGTTDRKARLGIPISIDAVEPLSPSLRYAALFPPLPHPFLGAPAIPGAKKASGAVQSDPIEIQIRFGASSKWPTDLKAMGAAKTAMLIQLLNGIGEMKQQGMEDCDGFDGPTQVTPTYADVGFMGYVFRVFIRADPELKLLRGLMKPSPEASSLLRTLTRKHVVASSHHSMVHAVYTRHASSSAVARMAKRWVSSHLLSGMVPFEAVELLVAKVYSDTDSPLEVPGTVVAGFLRVLHLLATYDWAREPMVVDPQGILSDDDRVLITTQFDKMRGSTYQQGPPMYIVSPSDRPGGGEAAGDPNSSTRWTPSFTEVSPEWVVLTRATVLAQRSHAFLTKSQQQFEPNTWSTVFHETTDSFKSYSALLRVDLDFIVDSDSSSTGGDLDVGINKNNTMDTGYTRSMRARLNGPKDLRRKLYRNLMDKEETKLVLEWRPVDTMVEALRKQLGSQALFFYNDLCPEVVAVLWRPLFTPRAFSAMVSESVRPVIPGEWKADTLVTLNVQDVLREVEQYTADIVTDCRVFDGRPMERGRKRRLSEVPRAASKQQQPGSDSSDGDSSGLDE